MSFVRIGYTEERYKEVVKLKPNTEKEFIIEEDLWDKIQQYQEGEQPKGVRGKSYFCTNFSHFLASNENKVVCIFIARRGKQDLKLIPV